MRNLLSGTGEQEMRHPKRSNNSSLFAAVHESAPLYAADRSGFAAALAPGRKVGRAWSPNLFGPAVKLCNLAIQAPQSHDVSDNEPLGRCSRTDIVWIVQCNFSDEMAVLAKETKLGIPAC
jgi:hypothetical protein